VPIVAATGGLMLEDIFIIGKNGDRITELQWFRDGNVRQYIYLWQR
jgi:hypothetical protein